MPDIGKYNFEFQPASYWGPQPLAKRVGSKIKGELRRRSAVRELEQDVISGDILKESLTEDERSAVTRIHPWLMGGEFLPNVFPNEVEIGRVVMKSTTMDVVSIRTRRTKHRVVYRIVGEYEDEGYQKFEVHPKTSTKPLTFRKLVSMMDGAVEGGLVGSGRKFNFDEAGGDPEEFYDFETASSQFYPQLAAWYNELNAEWLDAIRTQREEEEREDEERAEAGGEP